MASIFKGIRYTQDFEISKAVKAWMIAGLIMVFMQVVIGGITRLTGSGLSITKWEIVTGAIPPLSEAAWSEAFELYKQTPQYQRINAGMQLSEFKFIFFWEYFHRLWARLMFFVFIIPFGWFLYKGMFSRRLLPRMVTVVLLAGLEGFFGWIMVASGLIKRPWVNAYNLTLHLTMALIIFSYLLWTTFIAYQPKPERYLNKRYRQFGAGLLLLTFVQLALGAMMSGTKAGLFFPTWPDIGGAFIPGVLVDASNWQAVRFIEYDTNPFMPALVQFLHRNTAYLLSVLILCFVYGVQRQAVSPLFRRSNWVMVGVLFTQVLLGIITLLNCKAKVPVDLGVAHQAVAVLLLGMVLFVNYQMSNKTLSQPEIE
jgi:cytochrome c oxidase assembly protein subunit 15